MLDAYILALILLLLLDFHSPKNNSFDRYLGLYARKNSYG